MPVLDLASLTAPSNSMGGGEGPSGLNPGISTELARPPLTPQQPVQLTQPQQGNGLSMISDFAQIQNQLNQNKLFQQTFKARQKAGQIMATAPDVESGIQSMLSDPDVAPFAGETINAMREGQQTLIATQGKKMEQAQSGLQAFIKSLPAVMADPSQWDDVVKANLATLSPSAREAVVPAIGNIKHALLDGLPDDPQKRELLFNQRLSGLMIGSGITTDQIAGLLGKPTEVNTGGKNVFGVQLPSQLGGGFQQSNALNNTLAPTVVHGTGSEGQDVTTVMGGGGGGGGGGGTGGSAAGSRGVARPSNALGGSTIPPPSPSLIGPTQAQSAYNTDRAKDIVDYEKNLDDRVGNGATLRKNISEVVGAMHQATTGGGAETYAKLGSLLQGLGIKNPTVDHWANGSLAASQVIDKVALQNSMSQLKQQLTGVGGSRLNAQEFVAYLNKNPNLVTDPRAAIQVFNLWNQFYDRDKTEQAAFDRFKQGKPTGDQSLDHAAFDTNDLSGKPSLSRWPAIWNQSDFMKNFAPGGAISGKGVRGTDTGQITHKYIPGRGIVEVPAGGQ